MREAKRRTLWSCRLAEWNFCHMSSKSSLPSVTFGRGEGGLWKKGDDGKLCTATFFKQLSISAWSFFREDIVGAAETLIE